MRFSNIRRGTPGVSGSPWRPRRGRRGVGLGLEALEARVVLSLSSTTTTTLIPSAVAAQFGDQVTFTANVTSPSPGTPTGTVEFLDGTTDLGTEAVNGGTALLKTTSLQVGADVIKAVYSGDTTFATSTSTPATVTVSKAATTTALVVAPSAPRFGQPVTLTATVRAANSAAGTPTGTVEFLDGTTEIQTIRLTGDAASLTTSALPVGGDQITAVYQSDDNFAASTSTATTATVAAAATSTTLGVTPAAPALGQSVTLTATVAAVAPGSGTPSGVVTFLDGGRALGTGTLSKGVATLTTAGLTGGANVLTASYATDGNFAASTSAATTVTVPQSGSSTTVTLTPNPSALGKSVTLQATVTPAVAGTGVTPTGTITFLDGTTSLGTATLSGGVATLATAALPLGSSSVTAGYAGDASFTASTSAVVAAQVVLASTTTTLAASNANPGPTESDVLTATVTSSNAATSPTGTVIFYQNGTSLGSATLSGGTASLTAKNLAIGDGSLTAVYQGDANNTGSTSAAVSVSVGTPLVQFLNQVYLDLLGRPIDQTGLSYWLGKYVASGGNRLKVVSGIAHTAEARRSEAAVTYQTTVGTSPTTAQVNGLLAQSHGSTIRLDAAIFGSSAFYTKAGATVAGYLAALGQDVFGTALSASETAQYTAELSRGVSRTSVAHQLLTTTAGYQAQVQSLYQVILNRAADAPGLNRYVGILARAQTTDPVKVDLLASDEFFALFTA